MLVLDEGRMYAAVSDHSEAGGAEEKAYLNRRTGQIIFVTATAAEGDEWYGVPPVKMAALRAGVENRPSDWLEIPRFRQSPVHHKQWCDVLCRRDVPRWQRDCSCGARAPGDEERGIDEHIRDFLRSNDIDAVWR
jgi:hypothetical protein